MNNGFDGAVLKELRLAKGYKTTRAFIMDLYRDTGVNLSHQTVDNHENGTHSPRLNVVAAYEKFFKVGPNKFRKKV